jgi:hypothetical protein
VLQFASRSGPCDTVALGQGLHMNRRLRFAFAVIFLVAVTSTRAGAAPITFTFTADVTAVSDGFGHIPDELVAGTELTGFYEFDSDAPRLPASTSTEGRYALTSFSVSGAGGFSDSPDTGVIRVFNNEPGLGDAYQVLGIFQPGGGIFGGSMQLLLQGINLSVLTSTDLLTTPPSLDLFPQASFRYFVADTGLPSRPASIDGTITSLGVQVPEPASLTMFGVALLGLATARRYRRHRLGKES